MLRCVAERHTQLGDLEAKVAFENEILRVLGRLRPTQSGCSSEAL
ncbi:GntR transcriptional regulator [Pseudomonas amygdali pv. lachrymans]|nr:GntR transcriptional regulator [Pseudomonas amygdali pv. lachrymans]